MNTDIAHLKINVQHKLTYKINMARHIRKIGKAILNALIMDAEPIFKSEDWPYY